MLGLLMTITPADSFLATAVLVAVWQGVWPYLLMLAGFSLIIFVHELGHFAVAKWAGIRVERFAIGFGRELVGFTRGETRYSFNILPLGGYVKMLGQEDFNPQEEEQGQRDPRSFANKSVRARMFVVAAGVVMNIILAAILFVAVCMSGIRFLAPVAGGASSTWRVRRHPAGAAPTASIPAYPSSPGIPAGARPRRPRPPPRPGRPGGCAPPAASARGRTATAPRPCDGIRRCWLLRGHGARPGAGAFGRGAVA